MLLKQEKKKEDPRITRTRQLLHHAFLELLREKSFQEITIQDISERATVNRVTFYAHFLDKNDLLEYSIREMFKERLHSALPESAPFTHENLAILIRALCEFLGEMTRECPAPHGQMDALIEKQIKETVSEVLLTWLEEFLNPNPDTAEKKATITAWAIYGAAVQWSQKTRSEPVKDYVQQIFPIILASLDVQIG
jgi:AcrR family transcriptional regulator